MSETKRPAKHIVLTSHPRADARRPTPGRADRSSAA
jgi:hypothetical protein